MMTHSGLVDFVVTAWIVSLIVLLLVFVRYGVRMWGRFSWQEMYWQVSAAIAMSVYDAGNLLLIIWFWTKSHTGHFRFTGTEFDRRIIILGCMISLIGLFCKIRVFSDSTRELFTALAAILGASVVSVIGYHFLLAS